MLHFPSLWAAGLHAKIKKGLLRVPKPKSCPKQRPPRRSQAIPREFQGRYLPPVASCTGGLKRGSMNASTCCTLQSRLSPFMGQPVADSQVLFNVLSLGKITLTVSATRLNQFIIPIYTDFSDSGQRAQPGV